MTENKLQHHVEDRNVVLDMINATATMMIGSYGMAFFLGKLGVLPAGVAEYGLLARGAIITVTLLATAIVLSVMVGTGVGIYLNWRFDHLPVVGGDDDEQ